MPQPIEVKSQAEQQSLPHLYGRDATRCFGRELTFDHREDRFYFGARPIQLPRKSAVHLVTDSSSRDAAARFGRNDAVSSQRAAHVPVIGFGVQLRVRQHHSNGHGATRCVHQAGQSTRVAPRTLSRSLRQNDLAIHIDHDQPLQKVFVARLPALMLLNAAYEIGTGGVRRKPGTVHCHASPASAAARTAAQSPYRFSQRALDGIVRQPPQEAIHGAVVGHARQSQHGAQLRMLAQSHLGFAESPIFVTHQAEYGQQLRLGELVFAETTPISRKNRRGYIHSHASKRQESDLGHRTSCSIRKHHHRSLVLMENQPLCQGCKQSLFMSLLLSFFSISRPVLRPASIRLPQNHIRDPRSRRQILQSARHLIIKILRHIFRRGIHRLKGLQIVHKLVVQPPHNLPHNRFQSRKIHQQPNRIQLRPLERHPHAIVVPMHVLALPLVSAKRMPRRKCLFHADLKHSSLCPLLSANSV
jgi:hypothetical protein